ncbi:hypothetical protein E2C01_000949 [Portunus trituberculatus]|uniref:Uncharacterized protein n=1 Tax=Portunus trituberculatus TaxID=210409 RepID=A0A5B7CLA3_PORTR|nr:hypothetical protein [Portunus trituberculatus]
MLLLGVTLALKQQQHGNTRDWYQYTKSENSPDHRASNNNDMRRRLSTSSVGAAQVGREGIRHTETENAESVEILHGESFRGHINSYNPMKMARFVADPHLVHLIEDVDEEEQETLRETTASIPLAIERGGSNPRGVDDLLLVYRGKGSSEQQSAPPFIPYR